MLETQVPYSSQVSLRLRLEMGQHAAESLMVQAVKVKEAKETYVGENVGGVQAREDICMRDCSGVDGVFHRLSCSLVWLSGDGNRGGECREDEEGRRSTHF